jgi:hypothetical protein
MLEKTDTKRRSLRYRNKQNQKVYIERTQVRGSNKKQERKGQRRDIFK